MTQRAEASRSFYKQPCCGLREKEVWMITAVTTATIAVGALTLFAVSMVALKDPSFLLRMGAMVPREALLIGAATSGVVALVATGLFAIALHTASTPHAPKAPSLPEPLPEVVDEEPLYPPLFSLEKALRQGVEPPLPPEQVPEALRQQGDNLIEPKLIVGSQVPSIFFVHTLSHSEGAEPQTFWAIQHCDSFLPGGTTTYWFREKPAKFLAYLQSHYYLEEEVEAVLRGIPPSQEPECTGTLTMPTKEGHPPLSFFYFRKLMDDGTTCFTLYVSEITYRKFLAFVIASAEATAQRSSP